MSFYASSTEETGALRRAAGRVGARVETLETFGPRSVGRVICRDGWHAAAFLLALAEEDAQTDGARMVAANLRETSGGSDAAFAEAIHAFVKRHVRFVRERGEVFISPGYLLEVGAGDCDDHARAVYAIARAGDLPVRLALLHRGAGPTHVLAQLGVNGAWRWAETTVDARFGENPLAAARRLGVLTSRADIGEGVRFMANSDLPPAPSGYHAANLSDAVERDAKALRALGHLSPLEDGARCPGDAADPIFRRAVLAFQRTVGITADGLTGPQTRRALAGALEPPDAIGYLGTLEAKETRHLSAGFFRAVEKMAAEFRARGANVTAEQFLAVWLYESGIHADIPNGSGAPYYGLNQMGVPQLRAAGFLGSPGEWMSLTAEQQIPFVARYYENAVRDSGGDWSTLNGIGGIYALNLAPAFAARAKDPDAPIVRKDSPDKRERDVYGGNKGLDVDGDGAISGRDLKSAVGRAQRQAGTYWTEARARLYAEGGTPEPSKVPGAVGAAVALLVTGALGAWAALQS